MTAYRKVRKDFDTEKEYSVDVSNCSVEEKQEVQQAFFDVGILWEVQGEAYTHTDAVKYTNTPYDGNVRAYLMYANTTNRCNMTVSQFLNLAYEPAQMSLFV